MVFKQKYLNEKGPFPFDFEKQRQLVFQRILEIIVSYDRNDWLSMGVNLSSYIRSFKTVYGMTSLEKETLIYAMINIVLCDEATSAPTKIQVMHWVNRIQEMQICLTSNFKIDNRKLFKLFKDMAIEGAKIPLKFVDTYVQQLSKLTFNFAKYGNDCINEVMNFAIEKRQLRYIFLFQKCIKTKESATKVFEEIFTDNSIWERNVCWFGIISYITEKFPDIDYSEYYHNIFQEIIKTITTLIDPIAEEDVKRILEKDIVFGAQPIIKSIAQILVNLIQPSTETYSDYVWSCIDRVFNIIVTSLDHVNQPPFLGDFFILIKTFVKSFIGRHRKESNLYPLVNEDDLTYFTSKKTYNMKMDEANLKRFQSYWEQIIPKLLLFEDQQCRLPKILSDLAMYNKQLFLTPILKQILQIVSKDDLSLLSLQTSKMTILFLQEFIALEADQEQFTLMIQINRCCLTAVEKLGISQNLDVLELVMKGFMYYNSKLIQLSSIQNLIEDIIQMLLDNLDSMSIALQASQAQQAQIFIDFRNIYFQFFLILDKNQIQAFSQRFLYKVVSIIPTHRQAYELIAIVLCFVNKQFPRKALDRIMKEIVVPIDKNTPTVQQQINAAQVQFLKKPCYHLLTTNQQQLKWYSFLVQCCYQYHPQNIVKDWEKLQTIMLLLLRQTDNASFVDWGMDILYNIIICLAHVHVDCSQFIKDRNKSYETLDINWKNIDEDCKKLIRQIYHNYFVVPKQYMQNRYKSVTISEPGSNIQINLKNQNSKLIDQILIPGIMSTQAIQEKKVISKILSIQQIIASGLNPRLPPHKNAPIRRCSNFEQIYLTEFQDFKKKSCQYLEWVLKILQYYDTVWNSPIMKAFHYFWREVHEQAPMSISISNSLEKIMPFYYPYQHTKKQLFHSPFLILNQAYIVHYMRIQLQIFLYPLAFENNPSYINKYFLFQMQNILEIQNHLRSFPPPQISIHQYHRMFVGMLRDKLSPNQPLSYTSQYLKLKGTDPAQAQRYMVAIRSLISAVKRTQFFFTMDCCLRDNFNRSAALEVLLIFPILQSKKDKHTLLQIFYLKLNFNMELGLLHYYKPFDLLTSEPQQLIVNLTQKGFKENNKSLNGQVIVDVQAKNKQMLAQIKQFLALLIQKLKQRISDKNSAVLAILILLYSTKFDLGDPCIKQVIQISLALVQTGQIQLIDIGRTMFFHIVYRFAKIKQINKTIKNIQRKMPFDKFLTIRFLGGPQDINYVKIKCQKLDSYFYPIPYLIQSTYLKLCDKQTQQSEENEKILMQSFNNEKKMLNFFFACVSDMELKNPETQIDPADDQARSILGNGHKLLNYILDANPTKIDIFSNFFDNFSNYPVFFYQRLVQKMVRLGDKNTVNVLKKVTKQLRKNNQPEYHKLSLYIGSEIIPSLLEDKQYIEEYLEYISSCSNEVFSFALNCLYFLFCTNFLISANIYRGLILRLREQKGSARLRHLEVFNTYMLAQGRFARDQAKQTIGYLLQGIEEGADEVSEAIVTMIVSCFIIAINLDIFQDWVQQPMMKLIEEKKLYKLNQKVGYEIDPSLKTIINEIIRKAKTQSSIMSKNLKVYSKIAKKVLGSITVYRFNDTFYDVLKDLILYVVNKPVSGETTQDDEIINQLKDSEYPENIYKNIVNQLTDMTGNTQTVIKKKLKYLEGIVISRSFISNLVELPDILSMNEKNINLDYITALSNMARIMTPNELTSAVERALSLPDNDKSKICLLMAFIMSAGIKPYSWKQQALKEILKDKKKKIVKQFISFWWKGKGQRSQQQRSLYRYVKNVQNPYSYFA